MDWTLTQTIKSLIWKRSGDWETGTQVVQLTGVLRSEQVLLMRREDNKTLENKGEDLVDNKAKDNKAEQPLIQFCKQGLMGNSLTIQFKVDQKKPC